MNKSCFSGIRFLRKLMLVFSLLLIFDIGAYAQSMITAKGVVLDEATKEPLIGVSVVEKGSTTNGVLTDVDGKFEIRVPASAQLVFTYVGYNILTKPASQSLIDVMLSEKF